MAACFGEYACTHAFMHTHSHACMHTHLQFANKMGGYVVALDLGRAKEAEVSGALKQNLAVLICCAEVVAFEFN